MSEVSHDGPAGAAGIREGAWRGARRRSLRSRSSRPTALQRLQRFLHAYPTVVPFVVLLLGLLLGVAVNPARFTAASNLSTMLTQVMVIGIVGIGQTLVILTAGIDLSVGVIMVISSVVMGRLAVYDGVPAIIAFPLGLLVGAAFGFLNGILVTRLKMPPFIVTLGHAVDHRRAQHVLFAERNDRHAGHRGQGLFPADHGQSAVESATRASCGARSSC